MSYLGKALFATQDCISFFLRLSLFVKDCQNPLQPARKKKASQDSCKFLHSGLSPPVTVSLLDCSAQHLLTSLLLKALFGRNCSASPCRRPLTFSTLKSWPFYASTPLEGPKGLKRCTPLTLVLPQPATLFFRTGPLLESLIPRNSAAGFHAGWPPTWRSLASNAILLPGPALMLTVPAATCLLVSLLVFFSNLPSLPMLSAFLHRKVQRPPILHSLSTSHS